MRPASIPPRPAVRHIPPVCKKLRAVVMIVVSREGALRDANRGFITLLPDDFPAASLLDIRDLFINPRFDQFAARRADRAGGVTYHGLMTIGDRLQGAPSFSATIYESGSDLLIVAEPDVARLEQIIASLGGLNERLVDRQRELARLEALIKKQSRDFDTHNA